MAETKENIPNSSSNEGASTDEAKNIEAAPVSQKRKTPLEMVRERQANMQAARRGAGKKGSKGGESGANATGADGVSKPVQIKRQMGG